MPIKVNKIVSHAFKKIVILSLCSIGFDSRIAIHNSQFASIKSNQVELIKAQVIIF